MMELVLLNLMCKNMFCHVYSIQFIRFCHVYSIQFIRFCHVYSVQFTSVHQINSI
jgi:hypothetical protein